MTNINLSKPVLVTGANGYVASWLVKRLLDEGITVHAAVRSPDNQSKISHLEEAASQSKGQIKFFKADLLTPGSYRDSMKGCELVFHTASPFSTDVRNPQKELIEPAVNGTQNILSSANEITSVKRVVVTSSCAAIYTDAIDCEKSDGGQLTENDWNTTASLNYQPYSYSKTLAEQMAWEMVDKQDRWSLVTINPCLILGPALNPTQTTSESVNILKMMGDGQMKFGAPKIGVGVVDVRDVAEAHFRAGTYPQAKGRYITAAHCTDFLEMAEVLIPKYGHNFSLPRKALPKWLLMLIGPMTNKLFTRRFIKNNVNIPWKASTKKIRTDLNMSFRPLKQTMEESFQVLIDSAIL